MLVHYLKYFNKEQLSNFVSITITIHNKILTKEDLYQIYKQKLLKKLHKTNVFSNRLLKQGYLDSLTKQRLFDIYNLELEKKLLTRYYKTMPFNSKLYSLKHYYYKNKTLHKLIEYQQYKLQKNNLTKIFLQSIKNISFLQKLISNKKTLILKLIIKLTDL